MNCKQVWVNLDEKDKSFGMTYVAFSRVCSLDHICVDQFNRERFIMDGFKKTKEAI